MKNPAVADQVFRASLRCLGLMLTVMFLLAGPVLGDGFQETSADGIQSKGSSENQSTFPPVGGDRADSPLIGGGVRTPPDIGASGTASSTPPVRTESPTGEPQILPEVSPVPAYPSDPGNPSATETQPLGQPDHLKKRKELEDSLQ
ncbi:MAG: hypothetical protein ABIU05_22055 [Nitrospirales bacterium]